MPDDSNKKPPKRNLQRLLASIGVKFPKDTPQLAKVSVPELNTYSKTELRHLPGFNEKTAHIESNLPSQLTQYLSRLSERNNDWAQQSDAIRVLTPEIERSAEIMVSTIISPTDIQTDTINVVCRETDLGDELESKISDIVSEFFNNTLNLGDRTYRYIKEALYGEGSSSVLILPQSNIRLLNTMADLEDVKNGTARILNNKKIVYDNQPEISEEVFDSTESLTEGIDEETLDQYVSNEMLCSLEQNNPFGDMKSSEIVDKSKDLRKQVADLFSKNKDYVIVSSDISALRRHKDKLGKNINKLTSEIEKHFLFGEQTPTYLVTDEFNPEENDTPALIELPSRAVIPVSVPGSPSQHIGYFILVDQWGTPINTPIIDQPSAFGPRKLTETSTMAAFGSPSMYRFSSAITDEQRYELTSMIFGITLKKLIDEKLNKFGLVGTTIEESNALTATVFRQVLSQKKSRLVFVPEKFMMYMCFDYREDGSGKSLTENISTLLALKTVLVVSHVMAATENSVNNKTIEVNLDDKQTNVQQYLELIRNAYISKKMMRFDVNPLTVQQDLIQKSLTIVPKGIKGLSDNLDIQTSHKPTGAIAPDNDLLEKITDDIITALQVPHSVLNKLSQNEYASSAASTNLYFSNTVKAKQRVVIKHMTKFVKLYAKYSTILQKKIREVLSASIETENETVASTEAATPPPKSDQKVKFNKNVSLDKSVKMAIEHLAITLPSPRIAVDKAQYQEIQEYISTVEKIIDAIFNDDMMSGDASQLQDTLRILRASLREKLVRNYVENIGFQSIYDLPHTEDINMDDSIELIKLLSNQKKAISDWIQQIVGKSVSTDNNQSPQNGGGGGGNDMFGNDFGGGMGGGGNDWGANSNDFENTPEAPTLEEPGGQEPQGGTSGQPQANDFENTPEPPAF